MFARISRPSSRLLRRRYFGTVPTVELDYTEYLPANGNKTDQPLLILHGLFGSKRNWGSLSKAFLRDLDRPVYALDLRNHGGSPFSTDMTYKSMAADVIRFIQKHSLKNVSILGHSMGGKVAMTVALSPSLPSSTLERLIVADIAPVKGSLSREFVLYLEAMRKIEEAQVTTRKEALAILNQYEKDPSICAFLLTNLIVPTPQSERKFVRFQIPVDILHDTIMNLGDFPYELDETSWNGKTLFVKGTKSAFINRHNIPIAEKFFPNMVLKTLETGHWVHAESPDLFRKMAVEFTVIRQ